MTMLALFPVTGFLTIQMGQECGAWSCGILSHRGGRFTEPALLLPPVNSVFWQLPVLRDDWRCISPEKDCAPFVRFEVEE